MWQTIGVYYGIVAAVVFLFGLVFGKLLKVISLGNRIAIGVTNSILLAVFWPLTLLCCIIGWCYEGIQLWKKL